jgi:hypothetical protein
VSRRSNLVVRRDEARAGVLVALNGVHGGPSPRLEDSGAIDDLSVAVASHLDERESVRHPAEVGAVPVNLDVEDLDVGGVGLVRPDRAGDVRVGDPQDGASGAGGESKSLEDLWVADSRQYSAQGPTKRDDEEGIDSLVLLE